jgi:hypothetical protein
MRLKIIPSKEHQFSVKYIYCVYTIERFYVAYRTVTE